VESVDSTGYDSPETELLVGFARPIDDPELQAMTAHGTAVFGDAVRLVADALGLELDEVRCEAEYAQTTEDLDPRFVVDRAGCVAGVAVSWLGISAGRTVVSLDARWRKGNTLEPDWRIGARLHRGGPGPTLRPHQARDLTPGGFPGHHVQGLHGARHVMTALPAINASPGLRRRGRDRDATWTSA